MITYNELQNNVAKRICAYYNEPNLTTDDYKKDADIVLSYVLQNGESVPGDDSATRFFIPSKYDHFFGAVGSIISYDKVDEDDNIITLGYELN